MTVKTINGHVPKQKLKKSIIDLIDDWVEDGQKVTCHTSHTKLSARLIIVHDGIRLTLNFQED
jgi:hypothetical protein